MGLLSNNVNDIVSDGRILYSAVRRPRLLPHPRRQRGVVGVEVVLNLQRKGRQSKLLRRTLTLKGEFRALGLALVLQCAYGLFKVLLIIEAGWQERYVHLIKTSWLVLTNIFDFLQRHAAATA